MEPSNNSKETRQEDLQPNWIIVPLDGPFIKIVRNATMWDRLRYNMAYDLVEMPLCQN